ncbi:toll/interleukin-1 receptor domain-containing protein [Shimia sp. MMG029]|uniref:toll/interleukin-1 receptor domain-containing protein n=1 Tax=Shimia sp. MMG029 TaxID=3021978 RepID=UPI0022FEEBD7|nr:toll/interleukin-1 receptor domain-containing protein [Shimia sp. MMG029]MDA5556450.1 toll/interleukin-1 receptor domain-containing protein [Shimia sp. MMG029]
MFGHDFFIAYSRNDGAGYAESLDAALSEGFSVHFDSRDYPVGNDLGLLSKIRVRNSRHLVIVATPDALTGSTWVKIENEQFVAAKKPPFIVDVDGAVEEALHLPKSDKLSGWIESTRTRQDDGS